MNSPFNPNVPIYHPCTAILIDDDESFLKSLRKALGRENAVLAFSSTGKALKHIHQAQDIGHGAFNLFRSYNSEPDNVNPGDDLFLLKSSEIRRFAGSVDRYKMVSVVIIDQVMPSITGLEFCSLIKDTGIKTILLTGKMTDQATIEAFNDGLIDRYVNKNDRDARKKIKRMMTELHHEYLLEKVDPLIHAYRASRNHLIDRYVTKELMDKIFEAFKFTEYYYLPFPRGFLLCDDDGNKKFCLIGPEQEQLERADLVEDELGPCEGTKRLRAGTYMAWEFYDDLGKELPWHDRLDDFLYPCQQSGDVRWSLIPVEKMPSNDRFDTLPWKTYKQELLSIPLNYAG
ncbi:MAG: hypothetical protein OQJ97_02985 [Rhodospirillales bacterium]|nr:hypothetical protein [Rhodospirillales bacterium]